MPSSATQRCSMPPGSGNEGRQGMSPLASRGFSRLAVGFGAGDRRGEAAALIVLRPCGWVLSQGQRRLVPVSLSPPF